MIVEFNGKAVKNRDQLVDMVTRTKPGATVPVKVMRDGKSTSVNVTIGELDLEAEVGPAEEESTVEEIGRLWHRPRGHHALTSRAGWNCRAAPRAPSSPRSTRAARRPRVDCGAST